MEANETVKAIEGKRRRSRRWIAVLLFVLLLAGASAGALLFMGPRDNRQAGEPRPLPFTERTPAPTDEPTPEPTQEPTPEPTEPPATPEPTPDYRKTAIVVQGETVAVLASREAAEELMRNVQEYFLSKGEIPDDAVTELNTKLEYAEASDDAPITAYDEAFDYLTGSKTPLEYRTVAAYFEYNTIPHHDTVISDSMLPAGIRVVRLQGRDGVERKTYNIVWFNGRKQRTEVVETVTVIDPINGDIRVGKREFPEDYILRRSFGSNPVAAHSLNMRVPMHGDVITLYGPNSEGFSHGIEISSEGDDTVCAAASGTVVSVMERGAYGLMIEIQHANSVTTRYARLAEAVVSVGDKVEAGAVLGKAAKDGETAVLHFELRIRGTAYNPLKVLSVFDIKRDPS
ncbi:MAG: peptidoglycan DD-metalloendopeptidase family protein [Clostridia bacterium]|nr:peptidoglycan DD-metalloendopeptidase family protein [Clostridia bacterium]